MSILNQNAKTTGDNSPITQNINIYNINEPIAENNYEDLICHFINEIIGTKASDIASKYQIENAIRGSRYINGNYYIDQMINEIDKLLCSKKIEKVEGFKIKQEEK